MTDTDQSVVSPAVRTRTAPTFPADTAEAGVAVRDQGGPSANATLEDFRTDLRNYMIERFRADEISRADLNRFLRRFGMATCKAPIRVHYTLTGHVEIDVATGDGVDRAVEPP